MWRAWCEEPTHWKRAWCWERLKAGGEGATEDEMVGWHHWLNGHEFKQTPGAGEGRGSLVCCSPQGGKESDMTKRLNDNNKGSCHFFSSSDNGHLWSLSWGILKWPENKDLPSRDLLSPLREITDPCMAVSLAKVPPKLVLALLCWKNLQWNIHEAC